jgi:hypothetical protein
MPVYDFSFAIAEGIFANVVPGATTVPTFTTQTAGTGYGSPLSATETFGVNLGPAAPGNWNAVSNSPNGIGNQLFIQTSSYSYSVVNPSCSNKWIGSATSTKVAQALLGLPQPIYNFTFSVFLTNNDVVGAPSGAQLTLNFPLTGKAGYVTSTGPTVTFRNCPSSDPTTGGTVVALTNQANIPMEIPTYASTICYNPVTGQASATSAEAGLYVGSVIGNLSDGVYQNAIGTVTKSLNVTGNPVYTVHMITA